MSNFESALNKDLERELVKLLITRGKCNSQQEKEAFMRDVGQNPAEGEIQGDARTFLTNFIGDLNDGGHKSSLEKSVTLIEEFLKPGDQRLKIVRQIKRALEVKRVHILTSVKGGVGKTLTSLAIETCYYNK